MNKKSFALAAAIVAALGTGSAAYAAPIRTASGSSGGLTWQAQSLIVGTTSTATLAGGGNPIYFPSYPQYNGTVALIMQYGTSLFICSGALMPDRRSILTAAHCVSEGTDARPDATTAYFYGGPDPDTVVPFNALATAVPVSSYYVNAGYSGEVIDHNDVAVLRLAAEAPAFAVSYELYEAELTGVDQNVAGYGRRSDTGGAVGSNLGTGRLRQGDNRFDFRFGDADFLGFWDGFFGPASNEEFSYVTDFDSGSPGNDSSCLIANALGVPLSGKYCNLGRGIMESATAGGDSGGPSFIDGKVGAVTSYGLTFGPGFGDIDGFLNNSFGEFSGFVPVYLHLDFIRGSLVKVPEPGSLALLGLGLIGLGFARRRVA